MQNEKNVKRRKITRKIGEFKTNAPGYFIPVHQTTSPGYERLLFVNLWDLSIYFHTYKEIHLNILSVFSLRYRSGASCNLHGRAVVGG